ncbi:hypothetical protein BJ741DRAFT_49420 [Chytriomyces cf. hyalinus JEL632]|nr:hypothetical protein BJ741DRAFT_49420 [Chytriomyces cf. hyalinus JEL632]
MLLFNLVGVLLYLSLTVTHTHTHTLSLSSLSLLCQLFSFFRQYIVFETDLDFFTRTWNFKKKHLLVSPGSQTK